MAKYIDKDALVAEIERLENKLYYEPENFKDVGAKMALDSLKSSLNTLEVKEMDLDLITGWFDHIAQIADDRMTLTNQRMTDAHALNEIKCLAKNSSEFIIKHYKAQKGE
jgi:predicted transcriptional regulator